MHAPKELFCPEIVCTDPKLALCAGLGFAHGAQTLQPCGDLFRLSPELASMPDEASHALHSTLRQLDTGLSRSTGGAPPSALSSEGLTHAVLSLLCSHRGVQQGNDHSSSSMLSEEEECYMPQMPSCLFDEGDVYTGLDSMRWRNACALPSPQHESAPCLLSRGEEPAQHAEDVMGACSMMCDARQCESSAAAPASCSAARFVAESPSRCGGKSSCGEGWGFDVFNTSPSRGRKASKLERRQAAACRQILDTGKAPDRTGPQRCLF